MEVSEGPGRFLRVRKKDPPGMGKTKQKGRKMIGYLIDTDVLIDHLRGEEDAWNFLKESGQKEGALFYSVISKAEVYAGIRPDEEEQVALLFQSMNEVPVDGKIAEDAGRYSKKFSSSHGLLLPDALVAASAKGIGAVLVSLNKKHYPMKDVEVQVPYTKKAK
jgi:hypothetical protein